MNTVRKGRRAEHRPGRCGEGPLLAATASYAQPSGSSAIAPRCSRGASRVSSTSPLPVLLTADETADLLRTTRIAVYAMVARRQIPGVTRLGRRVLFRTQDLLQWLDQNRAPSPKD